MPSQPDRAAFSVIRFSTDDVPNARCLTFWREKFEQSAVRANVEPLSIDQFKAQALLETVPGLSMMSFASTAASIERTAPMLDDGDDALVLLTSQHGTLIAAQRSREVILRPGEAVLLLHSEPAVLTHSDARFRALVVPRIAVAGALRNGEDATMRHISANAPALRLLLHYAGGISMALAHAGDRTQNVIGSHVHDLIALVANHGAETSLSKTADTTGVRAARLAAIKADIISHIGHAEVTVGDIAARHRATPRTVQRLFAQEGSTFSTFKLEQQLVFARRVLRSNRRTHPTIADIAYAAGFSDLSYFHRSFRRRFGITPAEYREQAGASLRLVQNVRNDCEATPDRETASSVEATLGASD